MMLAQTRLLVPKIFPSRREAEISRASVTMPATNTEKSIGGGRLRSPAGIISRNFAPWPRRRRLAEGILEGNPTPSNPDGDSRFRQGLRQGARAQARAEVLRFHQHGDRYEPPSPQFQQRRQEILADVGGDQYDRRPAREPRGLDAEDLGGIDV